MDREIRRWDSTPEDVIVLQTGGGPQRPQPSAGIVQPQQCPPDLPPPEKLYYKTKLCDKFETTGFCMYAEGCTFAHGHADLRRPTHAYAYADPRRPPPAAAHGAGAAGGGRVCHNFRDRGICHYGEKCVFPHTSAPAGREIRNPAGEPKRVEGARRSEAPPAARASATAPRYGSAPGRAFPPVPAPAVPRQMPEQQQQGAPEVSILTLLSQRKTRGIYGDWPDHL